MELGSLRSRAAVRSLGASSSVAPGGSAVSRASSSASASITCASPALAGTRKPVKYHREGAWSGAPPRPRVPRAWDRPGRFAGHSPVLRALRPTSFFISLIEQRRCGALRFFLFRLLFQRFFRRPLFVEDQQPGQDIVPDLLRPAEAEFLFRFFCGGELIILSGFFVELRLMFRNRLDIGPSIRVQNGSVHGLVQCPKSLEVLRLLFRVVEAVLGFGQGLIVPDHQFRAEYVVFTAC